MGGVSMRAPASDLPIVLEEVSVVTRDVTILDRISLTLTPGAPSVLIGPNGAGKTTLMRLAMGLISSSVGASPGAAAKASRRRTVPSCSNAR